MNSKEGKRMKEEWSGGAVHREVWPTATRTAALANP
jgi:hypothetical protein